MIRTVSRFHKRALFIQPFVSVVTEKLKYLKKIFSPLNVTIVGYHGNQSGNFFDEDDVPDIAVCTIEKANSLVTRILEANRVDDIGLLIVDEIHMISDEDRGYLLELLITKLLYANSKKLQIIGLSATLPNLDLFKRWLGASIYVTDFRPVPLVEFVKIGSQIYNKEFLPVRTLSSDFIHSRDPDRILCLILEVLREGHSVLVFCSTKRQTEKTVEHLVALIDDSAYLASVDKLLFSTYQKERKVIIEKLSCTPGGLDPVLEVGILKGIGYHHAGLTTQEREIIENGFRSGVITVLMATSTLAAGVNLPARRVIFRCPFVGGQFLDPTRYKQMSGRAGRMGIDSFGESYIICNTAQMTKVKELMQRDMPPLESCLSENRRGFKRALLEAITSSTVFTVYDVERFVRSTLLASERSYGEVHSAAKLALQYLSLIHI
eukprot:TRINITY_DN12185_c0_g1_i1.p1 TRINITY_DN12185_c0_g1~~TRINITY_DN12185_c0_g1_i1.p1  ORF type:complete len:435 (-),score=58.81 TRINITY_DN12185_c0_g1_i1:22-1326(-)